MSEHPFTDPAAKPEMSATEASFHESVAGQRAAAAAREQGADPQALDSLARATIGETTIGGIKLKPASEGTFITLRKVASMFARRADELKLPHAEDPDSPGERELYELGLASLVFSDPRRVFRELNIGNLPSLMNEAMDLIFELPLADQVALKNHIESCMAEISRLAGDGAEKPVGKPGAEAAGDSPAKTSQAVEPPSPPSNGSSPNTTA